MTNPAIDRYVGENLSRYGVQNVRSALIKAGYDAKDVEESLTAYRGGKQSTQQVGSPSNDSGLNKKVTYAGFWIRFSAAVWDSIIIGIPSAIIQFIVQYVTGMVSLSYIVALLAAVMLIYLEGTKGATPGKSILALKVENMQGQIIGVGNDFLRYICKILSAIILGIGFLMIGWDANKQGLHDKLAKTYVVKLEDRKGLAILGIVLGIILIVIVPIVLLGVGLMVALASLSGSLPKA